MGRYILVDGLNLAYRCYHAIPHLSRSDGLPTNALHGWVRSLWKVSDVYGPAETIVVFDAGEDQERLQLLPEYKQQRQEMSDNLVRQLPYLSESATMMGFATLDRPGTEADDLIATLARSLSREGHDVFILSADKDLAQCVDSRVRLLLPVPVARSKTGFIELDAEGVEEKFGVGPECVADLLALVGDTSDNIPGLPGVGPKTAAKWLREFGDVEGVISNAGQLTPRRFSAVVEREAENLRRNLRLTRLHTDITLPAIMSAGPDTHALEGLLSSMEMDGILADARKRYANG